MEWNLWLEKAGEIPRKNLPTFRFAHHDTHMEWPRSKLGTPAVGGERLTHGCARVAHCVTARWRNFSHYCRPLRQHEVWLTCSEHREALPGAPTAHDLQYTNQSKVSVDFWPRHHGLPLVYSTAEDSHSVLDESLHLFLFCFISICLRDAYLQVRWRYCLS